MESWSVPTFRTTSNDVANTLNKMLFHKIARNTRSHCSHQLSHFSHLKMTFRSHRSKVIYSPPGMHQLRDSPTTNSCPVLHRAQTHPASRSYHSRDPDRNVGRRDFREEVARLEQRTLSAVTWHLPGLTWLLHSADDPAEVGRPGPSPAPIVGPRRELPAEGGWNCRPAVARV